MSPQTDNARIWRALREAGRHGLHSHKIRIELHSGNPSQRIRDLEEKHGVVIPRRSEAHRNADNKVRPGVRYFHPDFAPADLDDGKAAPPPGPNVVELSGRKTPAEVGSDSSSGVPTPGEPAADSGRTDETAQLGLLPQAPAIYTDDAA